MYIVKAGYALDDFSMDNHTLHPIIPLQILHCGG